VLTEVQEGLKKKKPLPVKKTVAKIGRKRR